jgi:signal transduction histidine kinase
LLAGGGSTAIGIVQILRSRSDGRQAALLQEAETAAQRCREVMAAMVRLGGDEVEASPPGGVDLATVARGVVAAVAPAWERRDLRIAMDDAGGAVPVSVGAHITGRVVAQVLSALRAVADPGTEVRVRAENGTGRAMLRFVPDRPMGHAVERRDDLRAASLSVWAARRAAEDAGGRLVDGPDGWRLEFPA